MADVNELFLTLDDGTGAGSAANVRQEGEAAAAQNGSIGFAFKDSNGDVILPSLTADGKIPVTGEAAGTIINASATVGGNPTNDVDVVVLSGLTASKAHECTMAIGAATKEVLWSIVQVDDATETVLARFITGAGAYSFATEIKLSFDTGATGAQSVKLVGNQLKGPATDLHGTLKAVEAA